MDQPVLCLLVFTLFHERTIINVNIGKALSVDTDDTSYIQTTRRIVCDYQPNNRNASAQYVFNSP